MVDFQSLAATAARLISKNGRDVVLVKGSRTAADPTKPWRGSDPTDEETVTVRAAVTDFSHEAVDLDLIRRGDGEAYVAAVDGQALEKFDFLDDGTKRWKVGTVDEIKPATVVVAYRMELNR